MNVSKKSLLLGILITAWIPCLGQGIPDSLKPYCQPKWIAWQIARDLSTLDRQTILLDSAHKVIELKNEALQSAELTIQASDSAYQAKDNEAKECRSVVLVSKQLHKSELKQVKKKAFKRGLLAGIALGLIALVI